MGPIIDKDSYSDVVYKKEDQVACLLLDCPETFDAKRGIRMNGMADTLMDAAGDPSITVAVDRTIVWV